MTNDLKNILTVTSKSAKIKQLQSQGVNCKYHRIRAYIPEIWSEFRENSARYGKGERRLQSDD